MLVLYAKELRGHRQNAVNSRIHIGKQLQRGKKLDQEVINNQEKLRTFRDEELQNLTGQLLPYEDECHTLTSHANRKQARRCRRTSNWEKDWKSRKCETKARIRGHFYTTIRKEVARVYPLKKMQTHITLLVLIARRWGKTREEGHAWLFENKI